MIHAGVRASLPQTRPAAQASWSASASILACRLYPCESRLAAIVVKGLHARHADGNFGQPFTPGPAESICDDHGDGKVQGFFQIAVDSCGGAVGIVGQQQRVTASVNVGDVNARCWRRSGHGEFR